MPSSFKIEVYDSRSPGGQSLQGSDRRGFAASRHSGDKGVAAVKLVPMKPNRGSAEASQDRHRRSCPMSMFISLRPTVIRLERDKVGVFNKPWPRPHLPSAREHGKPRGFNR